MYKKTDSLKILKQNQKTGVFLFLFLLILSTFFITKSNVFKTNSNLLSFGVTFDLLFTIPFIYYLLIRKTNISNKSISFLLTLNFIFASYILPKQNQFYLAFFQYWILPVLELFIIGFLVFNVKKSLRKIKKSKTLDADFFTILKQVIYEFVPKKLVIPLATEIAVFYYGFIHWKKAKLSKNEFSYHKNSGVIATLVAFMITALIEIIVIHKLVINWNTKVAWILVAISIYTIIQVYGIIRALPQRPIIIGKNGIYLRYSFLSETYIKSNNIDNIEIFTKEIDKKGNIKYFSPFGKIEGNNIKIELKNEITINGFYGIKRKAKSLVLFIDEKEDFIKKVNEILK